MDAVACEPFTVAHNPTKIREKREKTIRARLSPTEAYSWNAVFNDLLTRREATDESSAIRWLINNYSAIRKGKAIMDAAKNKKETDATFNAIMDAQ